MFFAQTMEVHSGLILMQKIVRNIIFWLCIHVRIFKQILMAFSVTVVVNIEEHKKSSKYIFSQDPNVMQDSKLFSYKLDE